MQIKDNQGFSLIETVIATALLLFVMAGFGQVLQSYFKQQQVANMAERNQELLVSIVNLINNQQAWRLTVDDPTNTNLDCIKDPAKFPAIAQAGNCTMASGGTFDLLDTAGAVFVNTNTATAGYTLDSGACNTYSAAGNSACPLRAELTWRPLCVSCTRNQVEITITIRNTPTGVEPRVITRKVVRYAQNGDVDLVLNYKLEGALATTAPTNTLINDQSGYGNNGRVAQDSCCFAGALQYVAGRIGSTLQFASTNHRWIEVPNNSMMRPTDITVAAWAKREEAGVAGGVIALRRAGSFSSYILRVESSGRYEFCLAETSASRCVRSAPLANGVWRHVLGTWDGNTIKLYIDSVQVDSLSYNGPNVFSGESVLVGAENDSGTYKPFPGVFDEVKLWKRALTSKEVLTEFTTP